MGHRSSCLIVRERTPHNDPYSRGVFFGMTSDTTNADLAVAVLEGVAFAFADGLEVLVEGGERSARYRTLSLLHSSYATVSRTEHLGYLALILPSLDK